MNVKDSELIQWMCVGLLFGIALGTSTDHLGICMVVGELLGIAIGIYCEKKPK